MGIVQRIRERGVIISTTTRTSPRRRHGLRHDARLEIVRRLDAGIEPAKICALLNVPLRDVYKARAYALRLRSRAQAARDFEAELAALPPIETHAGEPA